MLGHMTGICMTLSVDPICNIKNAMAGISALGRGEVKHFASLPTES